jgi:hypothetical protein
MMRGPNTIVSKMERMAGGLPVEMPVIIPQVFQFHYFCIAMFFIGKQPSASLAAKASINQKNELIILDSNASDYHFLREALTRQYTAMKERKQAKGD